MWQPIVVTCKVICCWCRKKEYIRRCPHHNPDLNDPYSLKYVHKLSVYILLGYELAYNHLITVFTLIAANFLNNFATTVKEFPRINKSITFNLKVLKIAYLWNHVEC